MGIEDINTSGAQRLHPQQQPSEILLGRYRVLSRRGTGGFGTVCTCWDANLQRRVAIKRIPLRDGDADGIGFTPVQAVRKEARSGAMLNHPNIVSVFDYKEDEEGGYAYIIMEYVDGLNLAELLGRVEGGRLTCAECAHILSSCAQALAFAHENKVFHLDIKPTNIMIDRTGAVKIADLGMAEMGATGGYGHAEGGTVGYMPPEQIEGLPVDERADVFALAVVLWQALTGKNPFAAPTAAASLEKIRRGPKENLFKVVPEMDLAGEQALLCAMSPDPADRLSSVDELACQVVPALGDATEGRRSLVGLVEQAERDDGEEEVSWSDRLIPWHERWPGAWSVVDRAFPALLCLACLVRILPAFAGLALAEKLGIAVAATAAAAAWRPAAGLVPCVALVLAVAMTSPTSASFILAGTLGVALAAWWWLICRKDPFSAGAVLLPWASGVPVSGAQLAGFSLNPLPAAAAGAAGALAGMAFDACAASGFAAETAAPAVLALLGEPAAWAVAAGCAGVALVSSAPAMRGTVASGIVGQALGLATSLSVVWLYARVENDGIWGGTELGWAGAAVFCFVLLCILTVLRGPLYAGQEGEDEDELP